MAQSVDGTSVCANRLSLTGNVAYKVEVNWGASWNDLGSWTDESSNMESMSSESKLSTIGAGFSIGGKGRSNTATIVMNNLDNRYSACQMYMAPIKLQMGYYEGGTAEMLDQFAGVITDPQEDTISKTITWRCKDRAAAFVEEKARSIMYTDQPTEDWLGVLALEADISSGDRIFDDGMFTLPYVWLDDESLADEMQDTVEADGGYLFFNKSGSLVFHNMYHWLVDPHSTDTASTFDFTIANFQELSPKKTHKEVFSGVIVEHQVRDAGGIALVYSRDDVIYVPPDGITGGSAGVKARLSKPATAIYDSVENTDFVALTAGGYKTSGSITVSGTAYAQQVELEFSNSSSAYGLYVMKFDIRGDPLFGGPVNEEKVESTASMINETKEMEIRGNPNIQLKSQAETLANFYKDRLEKPRMIYNLDGIPGVPWLELSDLVSVTETDSSLSACAYVVGMKWNFRPGGRYDMNLTLLEASALFPNTTDYFIMGSCALGDSSAKLFY